MLEWLQMKNLILSVLLLIVFGEITTLYSMNRKTPEENVLAEATVLPTETPPGSPQPSAEAATPIPSPLSSPTPVPLATPKPLAKGGQPVVTSQQINDFIDRFASQYGVDPNVLRAIAICESGFNPKAYRASYAGLFQFGSITWKNLRLEIGEDVNPDLRYNAEEAV
jgi:hypothetical protein